jgi:nucleoid DNA-binding protein
MNKRNLISKIASHFDLDETGVSIFVDSIFDTIGNALNKGKNINIPEFGKFIVRNKTSDGVRERFITFSPSKKFAEEINNNYSDLSPVVIKMLQPEGLGIKINEIAFEYGDDNFTYITFEDETDSGNETVTAGEELLIDEIVTEEEQVLSLIHAEEVIPETEPEEQPARDVPYLICITRDKHPYIPEEKDVEVFNKNDEIIIPIEEEKQILDEIIPPTDEEEKETVPAQEQKEKIFNVLPQALVEEDHYIEVIEEQISAEKEVIIKDIEDYLSRERKPDVAEIEETLDIKEQESIPEDSTEDSDNYFKRENVYTGDKNETTEKPQNVFLYGFADTDFDTKDTELNSELEIEQNVFLDLENFFNGDENENEELVAAADETDEIEKIITPSENDIEHTETHESEVPDAETSSAEYTENKYVTWNKQITTLKDDLDTTELEEEILQILASREKAIKELNDYGLKLETHIVIQPVDDSINDNKDIDTHEEVIIQETTQPETIQDDLVKADDKSIIEDTYGTDIYEELDKRYRELEEIAKTESLISEETKEYPLNSDMIVFDRLIEEKPEAVKDTPPPIPFQQIIIHDPSSRVIEKEPKSLADALDNVHLDGIIEHLEGEKEDSEVKSYDDVFKPADRPFIPNSTPELDFKKPKKWLKFFMYLVFIIIFSLMSFFLYKSILTPSKSSQHADTTGVKKYDSLSASLKLVDTSLNTGSIVLNEFEIEKDGDIIYRQTENGFIVQIASFEKHPDALKFITNLKDKSIDARIERIDLPMDNIEYRIVIGPFETLQEAKSYFSSSKMLLNYIKVLTPSNTNIFF